MTKKEYIDYVRTQAYWLNVLADEVERGENPSCKWCIDLELPELEAIPGRQVKTA